MPAEMVISGLFNVALQKKEKSSPPKDCHQALQFIRQLQGPEPAKAVISGPTSKTLPPVTLVCISDTHNTRPSPLPLGDILLHAGDLSEYGTFPEIQAQLSWIAAQPHPHKVVIAGNHDLLLDAAFVAAHPDRELEKHEGKRRADLDWGGIHYLEHETVELDIPNKNRIIRFFGSPWTPCYGRWAFQYDEGPPGEPRREYRKPSKWDGVIPPETDVVLVHGSPKGYLDEGGKGCPRLLQEIWRARPKVMVFGHIHPGKGERWLFFDKCEASYAEILLYGRRQWVSLLGLLIYFLYLVLQMFLGVMKSLDHTPRTYLVNAAMIGRDKAEERKPIFVVM